MIAARVWFADSSCCLGFVEERTHECLVSKKIARARSSIATTVPIAFYREGRGGAKGLSGPSAVKGIRLLSPTFMCCGRRTLLALLAATIARGSVLVCAGSMDTKDFGPSGGDTPAKMAAYKPKHIRLLFATMMSGQRSEGHSTHILVQVDVASQRCSIGSHHRSRRTARAARSGPLLAAGPIRRRPWCLRNEGNRRHEQPAREENEKSHRARETHSDKDDTKGHQRNVRQN